MPSATIMMKLPAARAGQVKALAAVRGLTATAALEYLLNQAIEAGEIPDTLPGYEVTSTGGFVVLTLDGVQIPGLHPNMALSVADDLEAAGAKASKTTQRRFYGPGGSTIDPTFMLTVGRIGSGIGVVHTTATTGGSLDDGERIVGAMTPGMAVDLARQIRAAVASQ